MESTKEDKLTAEAEDMKNSDMEKLEEEYRYIDENGEHLHTLRGRPLYGVSTIVSEVLAKNLTWWAAELSAVECLESGEKIPTIREEYLEAKAKGKSGIDNLQKKYPIFKKARFAHYEDKNKKAEEGTDLHELLERFVRAEMKRQKALEERERFGYPNDEEMTKILPFINWAKENVKEYIWSEANCYSEKLWVGGISDCGVRLKDGKMAIIDFKSAKEAYASHFIQTAGYSILISENGLYDPTGKYNKPIGYPIDALIIVPFGGEVKPVIRYDVTDLKRAFESCVTIYKVIKNS